MRKGRKLPVIDCAGHRPVCQNTGDPVLAEFLHEDREQELRQYACMLHYTCYQEAVSPLTLAPQTASVREGKPEDSERFADRNDYERMTAFEEMLLQQLSEGAAPQPMADSYPGELQNLGLDSMRQIKDNLLIFTALCARTAVKSGVPVYTAKTMENEWIRRIEAARGFSKAWKIRASMYNAFLRQVRQTCISALTRTTG